VNARNSSGLRPEGKVGAMPVRAAIIVGLLLMVGITPAQAQNDPPGAAVLKAVTVTITSVNYRTHQAGICHGSVYAVVRSVAYVVTAKHCVEAMSSSPLEPGIQWRDIREVVTVRFPNGAVGRVAGIFWPQNYDALVMKTRFAGVSRRPVGLVEVCRCGYYKEFPRSARLEILSMLSAGGGRPVPSSGYVFTDALGRSTVFLPSAHGTSGTLVVDTQGRMVGLVWGAYSQVEGGASFRAAITPAPVIMNLLKYAFDRDGVSYTISP